MTSEKGERWEPAASTLARLLARKSDFESPQRAGSGNWWEQGHGAMRLVVEVVSWAVIGLLVVVLLALLVVG